MKHDTRAKNTPHIATRMNAFAMLATCALSFLSLGGPPGSAWAQVAHSYQRAPGVFDGDLTREAITVTNNVFEGSDEPAGTGGDPENWVVSSSQLNAVDITYTMPSHTLGAATTFTGITCGSSFAIAAGKGAKPQAMVQDTFTRCDLLFNIGDALAYSHTQYGASYDSLKYAHEHCYDNSRAPDFSTMSLDVQQGGNGPYPTGWPPYKQWLISVLSLRHDATWFCADVFALAGALATTIDTSYHDINAGTNMALAVIQWLIQNPLCTNQPLRELYAGSRGSQRESWFNWPELDTSKTKLDTTLPSMHDLGLDSVLKYAAMLGVHDGNVPSIISNAVASPNPMGEGTVISFGTSREAFVKIEVFDLLGNVVANGFESCWRWATTRSRSRCTISRAVPTSPAS